MIIGTSLESKNSNQLFLEKNQKINSNIADYFSNKIKPITEFTTDKLFSLLKSSGYINEAQAATPQVDNLKKWQALQNSPNPFIKSYAKKKIEGSAESLWEVSKNICNSPTMHIVNQNNGGEKSLLTSNACKNTNNQCIINFTNQNKEDGENNFLTQNQSASCKNNIILSDLPKLIDPEGHSDASQLIAGKADSKTEKEIESNSQY